ncbi:sensor histidine kinase [Actinomadura scrupuli]|uniref:sensor histidine kinase n=1 Tax=Actinomadura scrupuli TaxID=559629 RepID=UPI003D97A5D1
MSAGTRFDRIQSCGGCLIRSVAAGFLGLLLLIALLSERPDPRGLLLAGAAAVAAAGALLRGRLELWATAAGTLSVAVTGAVSATSPPHGISIVVEGLCLATLVVRVVWRAGPNRVVPLTVLLGAAIIVFPLRSSTFWAVLLSAPLAVLVAIAVGVGAYLRAIDNRRARSLAEARRDERLELARDLHDFVAHHVTGIVVQAQAARFATGSGVVQTPAQLDQMLGDIEKAGGEALSSMRRLVGVLREAQGDAATRPVGDLAQIGELVTGFTDPPAVLTVAPDLPPLRPEIATSLHRVVQESLTNARKHAADATMVRVTIHRLGDEVQLAVRDNGQGRGRRLPAGGYGLAGLRERLETLGGRLHTGVRPEGGWEVVAVLPLGN